MKNLLFISLITSILFISCKKSDNPTPSTNNTQTNTAPVLQANLSYNATTATALQIDLTTKITDTENDIWSISTVIALHGSATITGKIISYTSNASYTGNDTISLSFQDSKGATNTGKIIITVSASTPVNHAPIFTGTSTTIASNGTVKLVDISSFVSDSDGDNITITNISGNSANISISNISGKTFDITPVNSVYAGVETLSITISDGTTTTTSNFTLNIGTSNQIATYNLLSSYFGVPLNGLQGTSTLNAGSITTTATQFSGDFFNGATSAGTYPYTIISGGTIQFTVGGLTIEYTVQAGVGYLDFIKVVNGDTYTLYP